MDESLSKCVETVQLTLNLTFRERTVIQGHPRSVTSGDLGGPCHVAVHCSLFIRGENEFGIRFALNNNPEVRSKKKNTFNDNGT